MLPINAGSVKDLISQKWTEWQTIMQGRYYVKSLTGHRHDKVQTESQQLQP